MTRVLLFEIIKLRHIQISILSEAEPLEMYADFPDYIDDWFKWSLEKDGPASYKDDRQLIVKWAQRGC